ncbi:hypothetical protein TNCV_2189301 [Trichonephila clavipes]|nr:hypothetical protein TNCV_2189301 [Trichonephila clavipes]
MRILVAQLGEFKSMSTRAPYGYPNESVLIDDIETLPLRRNRRQYEQLTDFDRGRIIGLREAGWSNRHRPPPRSERYGSCSVLATVDYRR